MNVSAPVRVREPEPGAHGPSTSPKHQEPDQAVSRIGLGTVCICIPTYNEAENVAAMVASVLEVMDATALLASVLVIDDSSPDGTGEIVAGIAEGEPRVGLVSRTQKSGIGPAYREGFSHALGSGADVVVQMDCDFSHDPGAIPRLVQATTLADVVIGSRYVTGGRVENWPLSRRAISRVGSWYARSGLRVPTRDLTGGFKCFRADALSTLLDHSVRASGYGFQIEMTYRAIQLGMHVLEVPITFRDRTAGTSKMSLGISLEAARLVLALRTDRRISVGTRS